MDCFAVFILGILAFFVLMLGAIAVGLFSLGAVIYGLRILSHRPIEGAMWIVVDVFCMSVLSAAD